MVTHTLGYIRNWTQSKPNNCGQTAVASILGIDPDELPDQVAIEADPGMKEYRGVVIPNGFYPSYSNMLNAYLTRHHGMSYVEMGDWEIQGIQVTAMGGHHVMCGPTIRTPETKVNHAVVGRHGIMVWDPHPSHAGLTAVLNWGVIAPAIPRILERWSKNSVCLCPKCIELGVNQ